jgi:hypothetical protein
MFGSKKNSEPPQPFSLRVLTALEVIEGTVAGDTRLLFSDLRPNPGDLVELSSVTITSIDPGQPAPRTCDRFVANSNNAVMLVPDADPTRLVNWGSYECFTKPYKGTFHAGPYLVRGTLMGLSSGVIDYTFVAVGIHVSTLHEGPECAEFDAAFAVVSFRAISGWEVE